MNVKIRSFSKMSFVVECEQHEDHCHTFLQGFVIEIKTFVRHLFQEF
jgi:hypothetical protein